MDNRPSLKESWIEHIFGRMSLTYGSRLSNLWSGNDPLELKAYWGRELYCFHEVPEVFSHALSHLHESIPPSLGEFKRLCANAPRTPVLALPAPPANPAKVAAIVGGMKPAVKTSPTSWALRLKVKEQGGLCLTAAQRAMWRAALRETTEGKPTPDSATS